MTAKTCSKQIPKDIWQVKEHMEVKKRRKRQFYLVD